MNTMLYEGFLAEIEIDEDAGLLQGIVVNAQEPFRFNARTVRELQLAFQVAVNDYREKYRSVDPNKVEPARPISKEQHSRVLQSARLRGRVRPGEALDYRSLQEAYDQLLEDLYLAYPVLINRGDYGQEGAKMACDAIVRFISSRWDTPEQGAPFLNLREALSDVQEGHLPEMFDPKRLPRARSRSRPAAHCKVCAAALHEVDIKHLKNNVKASADNIAKWVAKWPAFKKAKPDADTIKYWRTVQLEKRPGDRKKFDELVRHIKNENDPRAAVSKWLKNGPPGVPSPPIRKT